MRNYDIFVHVSQNKLLRTRWIYRYITRERRVLLDTDTVTASVPVEQSYISWIELVDKKNKWRQQNMDCMYDYCKI